MGIGKQTRETLVRAQLIVFLVLIGTGLIGFFSLEALSIFLEVNPRFLVTTLLSFLVFGGTGLIFLYLGGQIAFPALDSMITTGRMKTEGSDWRVQKAIGLRLEGLDRRVDQLSSALKGSEVSGVEISPAERQEILSGLRGSLPEKLADELREQFLREAEESALQRSTDRIFDSSDVRLQEEIAALSRRSNLNLVIGVVTTIAAVALLVYMVLGVKHESKTIPEMLEYFIPRVSTAAFIEIFSFFFLRLYKSTLADIRYYQDELTRLTQNRIALFTAEASEKPEILADAVRAFSVSKGVDTTPKQADKGAQVSNKEVMGLVEQAMKIAMKVGGGK